MIKMGNPELTALWNLNPNNMEACKSEDRYTRLKYKVHVYTKLSKMYSIP